MGLLITLRIRERSDLTCSPPQKQLRGTSCKAHNEKGFVPEVKKIQSLRVQGTAETSFNLPSRKARSWISQK